PGAWRRCNSLQWNDHCASLRLALHPENRTLQPVQRRFLGLSAALTVSAEEQSSRRSALPSSVCRCMWWQARRWREPSPPR
ncbi:MAG: hypothetical protein WC091_20910, partial [Sulfuricellaceae bacterium]